MTTLTPAGRRILDAASDLFYNEGIHAVGVEAVARRAEVTKKTLYDRFGSKDALVAAYLRARDARWRGWLTEFVEVRGGSPADQILATFDALAEWVRTENPRGCAFVNALSELPDPGHPGRAVIRDQKQWLLDHFARLATETEITNPDALAQDLFLLYEGAMVTIGFDVMQTPVARARAMAATVLTNVASDR